MQPRSFQVPWVFLIKVAVSASFLAIIAFKVDMRQMWEALRAVNLGYFFLAFLLVLLGEVPTAMRLQLLMRPTSLRFGIVRLTRIVLISRFYMFFLPAGLGSALSRWHKITRNKVGRSQFVVVLIVEKSLILTLTLLSVALPLLFVADPLADSFRSGFMPVLWILLAAQIGFYAFLLVPRIQNALVKPGRQVPWGSPRRLGALYDRVARAAAIYGGHWGVFFRSVLFTLALQVFLLAQLFLLFLALDIHLPVLTIVWISSLVFVLQALPISFGGIGVRESGFAYLLSFYGIAPERGVALGLLLMGLWILHALVGGAFELTDKSAQPVSDPQDTPLSGHPSTVSARSDDP